MTSDEKGDSGAHVSRYYRGRDRLTAQMERIWDLIRLYARAAGAIDLDAAEVAEAADSIHKLADGLEAVVSRFEQRADEAERRQAHADLREVANEIEIEMQKRAQENLEA